MRSFFIMTNKLLLIASCVLAVISDMLFVWWAKNQSHQIWYLVVAMLLLNVTGLLWSYTMYKGIESATAITFYALLTVAGCSFLGFVIFGEHISLTMQ